MGCADLAGPRSIGPFLRSPKAPLGKRKASVSRAELRTVRDLQIYRGDCMLWMTATLEIVSLAWGAQLAEPDSIGTRIAVVQALVGVMTISGPREGFRAGLPSTEEHSTECKRTLSPRRVSEPGCDPDQSIRYRIVGNHLHPRHRQGQSRENPQFILDHQPEL